MTLYLAGKMTGLPDYNFHAFHVASRDLRNRGYRVISPAEMESLEDYKDGVTPEQYRELLGRDLSLIASGDVNAIAVLPGWENSKGAQAEVALGRAIGLQILSYPSLIDLDGILATPKKSTRTDMLMEAAALVDGERNTQYGDPSADFGRTAAFWTTYLKGIMERQSSKGESFRVDAHDVGIMMIALKLSRLTWSPDNDDHFIDIAGYAACSWDCDSRSKKS